MTAAVGPGGRIGPYRIQAVIGRGGMGVVYLATETGLERSVALKVLAPEWAADPQLRERFERESRLAAAIDHPNIVPIYGAGQAEGLLWIAMRYVDGTDLHQELALRGPLEPPTAYRILLPIAAALDAAHARGLVHRDVKPANILIEEPAVAGSPPFVYLTDFGLTRRPADAASVSTPGAFIGSIAYAAPEQIEAKDVDGRADQYALACVLFHCLAGEPPFHKDFDAATMRAHLMDEPPPPSASAPELPGAVDGVLARGLAKDPADRFPSCVALVRSFAAAAGVPGATPDGDVDEGLPVPRPTGSDRTPKSARRRWLVVGGVAALVAAVVVVVVLVRAGPNVPPGPGASGPLAEAPATIGVVSVDGGSVQTAGGQQPGLMEAVVSPDGSTLAFVADLAGNRDIYSMGIDGSNRRRLTRSPAADRNASWSPDGGEIAFARVVGGDGDIYTMDADGSAVRDLTKDAKGATAPDDDRNPVWSPDGTRIAFVRTIGDTADVWVMGADGSDPVDLTIDSADERDPAWSPDGSSLAFIGNPDGAYRVYVMPSAGGTPLQLTTGPHDDSHPAWSPGGSAIAFLRDVGGRTDVFVVPAAGGDATDLTNTAAAAGPPAWSPDGRLLAFSLPDGADSHIYVVAPDGSGLRAVTSGAFVDRAPVWVAGSPPRLVFVRSAGP